MDPATIEIIKISLQLLILPFLYFMWEVRRDLKDGVKEREGLKGMIKSTQESNTKEHGEVIKALEGVKELIRVSERDNRQEHKELADTIHEIDKNNTREHAILANGGKL